MEAAEEIAKEEEKRKQEIKEEKSIRTSTRTSTAQNPVVKVLTSATFIRGAMGVLMKFLKK